MSSLLTEVLGNKKEWRSIEARADALPRDYRIVCAEIKLYLFRFASGDGMDSIAVLKGVLALFEQRAAEGTPVGVVTGEDVAAFCDQRLLDVPSYTDKWRVTLNRDIVKKLVPSGSGA
jgi:DNA-binding ferritin-like protein (Dps family)